MDDALRVGGVQRIGNLDGEVEQFVRLEQFPGNALLQGLALQQLHSDEGLAFVLADFVNRADVGMVQRRGGAGLALEAFQGLTVLAPLLRQELESDLTAQRGVLGLIDDTHAPAAELLNNAIVGNGPTIHEAITSQQDAGELRNDASIRRVYWRVNAIGRSGTVIECQRVSFFYGLLRNQGMRSIWMLTGLLCGSSALRCLPVYCRAIKHSSMLI